MHTYTYDNKHNDNANEHNSHVVSLIGCWCSETEASTRYQRVVVVVLVYVIFFCNMLFSCTVLMYGML